MAHLPTFEEIVLQVHQSLGLVRPASKHVNKFSELGFPLARHRDFASALLKDIFSALEMDEQAQADALRNIGEWVSFDRELAARTWTHEASAQQVLWHLLAYSWVPGLARRLAFWSLAGAERGVPFDAGMPGGQFWFLPQWDQAGNTVRLPVAQVIDWLFDLLGDQSLEQATGALRRETAERKNDNALRTLQAWRLEGTTPKSAKMIDGLFHDEAQLDYRGSFQPGESLSPEDRFAAALAFILNRKMQPEELAEEIPLSASRIQAIIDENSLPDDNERLVHFLSIRYAVPSPRTVRQRLRVARMMQDGYERLLESLCSPDASAQLPDGRDAMLLPLLSLFHTVYNLTIDSVHHGKTYAEQDAWFESQFATWDKHDLLLSIMPSVRETAADQLGERLTRRFIALRPDTPLQYLVPTARQDQAACVIEERIRLLKAEAGEDANILMLKSTIRRSSPWRALQAEQSYLVVSHLARDDDLPAKVREMAIARMRELASTPAQLAGARVCELAALILAPAAARPVGTPARVESLLDGMEADAGYEVWKAPLLRLRARHRLLQNDLDGACQDFHAALTACVQRNYGPLRFEIAREGLATEIARDGLVPRGQEHYFRHLMQAPIRSQEGDSLEDAAVACERLFWDELYQPYHGIQPMPGQLTDNLKALIGQSLDLIKKADFDGLKAWLVRHQKKFHGVRMKDARRDSLLLLWMKQMAAFKQLFTTHARAAGLRPGDRIPFLAELRQAIRILVELWPDQARIADFKGQTPLMLAADDGDAAMTELLAGISDVDAQDYIGRTALHAAVTRNSADSVAAILDLNPDVGKVTHDEGQTVLHTAVRFGNQKAVELIVDAFPCRAESSNAAGITPLEQARDLAANFEQWHDFMRTQNRRTGSKADFDAIVRLLQAAHS
jgi:hypothetical protein